MSYDLLLLLQLQGWKMEVKGLSDLVSKHVRVEKPLPKVIWMKKDAKVLPRWYLLALARLDDIKGHSHVEHLRDDAYYKELLAPKIKAIGGRPGGHKGASSRA